MRFFTDVFLLTSGSVDIAGGCELRFWGICSNGPVLIRIPHHRPVFFISRESMLPRGLFAERRKLNLISFDGMPVDGLYFPTLSAYHDARSRLSTEGIRTWESDVRMEDRFLMERFITGSARINGNYIPDRGFGLFVNPEISPSEWRPHLNTLSLDIETGTDGKLLALAMDVSSSVGTRQYVAVLDESAAAGGEEKNTLHPASLLHLPSESALLRFLIETVAETDPDIIIGWHVIGFDLSFLDGKSRALSLPLRIGRGHSTLRLIERPGSLPIARLEGRLVIDGPVALRGVFHKFSDWRLDTVAHELLGRRKDITVHGHEKVAEIERRFREDKDALARYNLDDATLVTEIFQRTRILDQLVTRSLITGLPPDQVHRSVAAFDHYFLPRLHRKMYVAPNQRDIISGKGSPGGMAFSRGAGLFEDVVILDFKSLYPTIIRTFHIDPYSLIKAAENPLETPVGINFSRSEHILPAYLEELMKKRAVARDAGDNPLSQAVKSLMNSMYGVMGSTGCRFYKLELPTAITGIGRWILDTSADRLESWGYKVLYGDTDSLFVTLKTEERQDADNAGRSLAKKVNEYFREIIPSRFGVTSRLELEYEKRYLRLFLPVMRSSSEAAVKRYAGLLVDGSVEIKGMEFVRSDATDLARDFQYELFRRYFSGEDLTLWIRETVARLKAGDFDDKLVYRRRLSRPSCAYKSPPPHVRAVKLLDPDGSKDLREVEYVITTAGPIPLELEPGDIDYSHYIEKQLRSLADDVLGQQGESFNAIISGKQLDLFEDDPS